MKRRLLTLSLVFAIVLAPFGPAVHGKKQPDQTPDKVKNEVETRVNKKENRVKVNMRSGSQVKGRITQTSDTGFTVTDEKSGNRTEIAYTDVAYVEGTGMSKKKKALIITGVVIAVAVTALIIALKDLDDFDFSGIGIR